MKTMYISKALTLSLALGIAAFAMMACDSSDSDKKADTDTDTNSDTDTDADTDSDTDTDATMSYIRVLHLSPDAPAVDIYANGAVAGEGLAYSVSTDYLKVPAGVYTFDVAPTGTSVDDSVLTVNDLELVAGNYYTAVAYKTVSEIAALALVDDAKDLKAGDIRVRAIHAAAGVGEVDIWNLPAEGAPAKLYDDVALGAVGDYLDLPAGAYTLGVDTNNDAVPEIIFALPALEAGTVANVFAVNDGGVKLIAQLWDGTTAVIMAD